ncbi:hypothetical protein [Salinisphaera hydrothermalis]|uniref:hypothetical protein n=1 Tax=Salinisphaera hydrothermalis TaxID=563188 RepID=UPI00334262B8
MAKSIETIRKRISDTKTEIEELRLGRLTRDETEQRLVDFVDEQARKFSAENFVIQATLGAGRIRDDLFEVHTRGVPGASDQFGSIAPWICWAANEQVKKHLINTLDSMATDLCSDTPRDEREKALADKLALLDELETEEERLVCESEQKGVPIPRRRDCRPEIVLAAEVA